MDRYGTPYHRASAPPRSPLEALEPARAPEPPERRSERNPHPFLLFLNTSLTLLVAVLIGVAGLFFYGKNKFDSVGPLSHSTVVVVPKGEGVSAIANRLVREGVISDRNLFVAAVRYFKVQKKLKAGEYAFEKHASMRKVLDTLIEGKTILRKITIPEGLTSEQIVQRLMENKDLHEEITEIPPEGSLLPDTYRFARNTTRADLISRMKNAQNRFIDSLWEKRVDGLPIKSKQEAIILASIVEKETGRPEERAHVAGVFINRLKKKIRLQSDPTIIYGIVGGKGKLGRPIFRSELNKKTAYNTYKIDGLPPTPIANPGRAAIESVLNPAETDDLFFVADGTGGHVFASTLREHRINVAKWRKIEAEIRARQAEQKKLAAARAAAEVGASAGESGALPTGAATSLEASKPIQQNAAQFPGLLVTPGLSPDALLKVTKKETPTSTPEERAVVALSGNRESGDIDVSSLPVVNYNIPLPLRNPRRAR